MTIKNLLCPGILALAAIACAGATADAGAQDTVQQAMAASFHLSPARGPVRPLGLAPFTGAVDREILAGPNNGLESAFVIHTRSAAGAKPTGLYTLPVDHTYLVLSGTLNVQLGDERFVVQPDTLVFVPAGVPHQAWNEGSVPAADFEVITPAPTRDLVSMITPASPRKVDNAAQFIHVAPPPGTLAGGTGHASLNERVLVSRANGSVNVLERLNDVLPGGGRVVLHLHPFDQVYFVRKGTMKVAYGAAQYEAGANSLVVLPAGVVHSNENAGATVQSVITLLLPEPPKGVSMGAGMTVTRNAPGAGASNE